MRCILSVCTPLDVPTRSLQVAASVDVTRSTWPGAGKKKENEDGMTVAKAEDFGRWYQELVVKSEMIEYSDISGAIPSSSAVQPELVRQSESLLLLTRRQSAPAPVQ